MTPDQSSTHPRAGSSLVAMAEPTQQPEPITGEIRIHLDDAALLGMLAGAGSDDDDNPEET